MQYVSSGFGLRVERMVEREVERRLAPKVRAELMRLQAEAAANLRARYEPSAVDILAEALKLAQPAPEEAAEDLLAGMSGCDRPETHLPQLAPRPVADLGDLSDLYADPRPAHSGTPNPGGNHEGRTIPAGPRSTAPWDGTAFAKALAEKGLSEAAVATALGVTERAVAGWRRSEYRPARAHRQALKALLGEEV